MVTMVTLTNTRVYISVDLIAAIKEINIVLTQNASEALNGTFTMSFMGHVTPALPHDIYPGEVGKVYSNNLVYQ